MKECMYCGGQTEERLVSRIQQYRGQWYLIENVPALVCKQSGETFYSPDSHDLVLHLVQSPTTPVRLEKLAVLDAAREPAL